VTPFKSSSIAAFAGVSVFGTVRRAGPTFSSRRKYTFTVVVAPPELDELDDEDDEDELDDDEDDGPVLDDVDEVVLESLPQATSTTATATHHSRLVITPIMGSGEPGT
jgi:hypothetical protein